MAKSTRKGKHVRQKKVSFDRRRRGGGSGRRPLWERKGPKKEMQGERNLRWGRRDILFNANSEK